MRKRKVFYMVCYILLILFCMSLYMACGKMSARGYGYPGYGGFYRHHYFYYTNSDLYYYGKSNRENSLSGSKYSQRGINGGK